MNSLLRIGKYDFKRKEKILRASSSCSEFKRSMANIEIGKKFRKLIHARKRGLLSVNYKNSSISASDSLSPIVTIIQDYNFYSRRILRKKSFFFSEIQYFATKEKFF